MPLSRELSSACDGVNDGHQRDARHSFGDNCFTDHTRRVTYTLLLDQKVVSGSGISWAICKSAT